MDTFKTGLDVWAAKSIVSWQRRQRKNVVLEPCFFLVFACLAWERLLDVKINVLHVFYHQNWPYDTSKPTFYECFTIRTYHMRRQNQRFTRVLPSELTIWDVKINVLHVFYDQNLDMRRQNQSFTRALPSELNMQDVKINVLCVFSHQITYSNASSEHIQNGPWTSGQQNQ